MSFGNIMPPKKSSTLVIAASNSKAPAIADYYCDGTADDVQINAAITAASTVGGEVLLLDGTFTISATITMLSNVKLIGAGFGTVIKGKNSTNINLITVNNKTGVIVSDLKLDGNKANQVFGGTVISQNGIYIVQGSNNVIRNVWCYQCVTSGLHYAGTAQNYNGHIIEGCYFNESTYYGIYLGNRSEYCRFIGCHFYSNGSNGVHIVGGGNIDFTGCMSVDNTGDGWHIDNSSGDNPGKTTITGCHSNHNLMGIDLQRGSRITVIGSHVIANEQHGVRMSGCINCIVSGNHIAANGLDTNNTYDEIILNDGTGTNYSLNNVITGNRLTSYSTNKARYGINEDTANCDYNIIANNTVTEAVTGMIRKQGANTIVRQNVGHITENSGTATVANGATTSVVTHGLAITPTADDISVTPTNNLGNAAKFWISTLTATQFTINVDADPGAGTATFAWKAIVL